MSVQALESEVAKLGEAELFEFGQWFDAFRDLKEMAPEVEEAHRGEVLFRREEYLKDKSLAKPTDAAYFAELRKTLGYA